MGATRINRPKKPSYRNISSLKRLMKQGKKRRRPPPNIEIPDAEIMPKGILKQRKRCPRANITLSGKKKRKILNQLRREQNDKARMEVSASSANNRKNKRKESKSKPDQVTDVEMAEA